MTCSSMLGIAARRHVMITIHDYNLIEANRGSMISSSQTMIALTAGALFPVVPELAGYHRR